MSGLEQDTIGRFNLMVDRQKNESGEAFVTTVLFDNNYELLHDRRNIRNIKPIMLWWEDETYPRIIDRREFIKIVNLQPF